MRTMLSNGTRKSRVWVGMAIIAALAVGALLGSFAPRSAAAAQDPSLTFSGGSALLLNYVARAKTADFEKVMRAYGEELAGSDDGQRNQQAAGLKVFRAAEPGQNNTVLYVWVVDPVVSGANYAVMKVLNDELPPGPPANGADVQAMYEAFSGSFEGGGQQPINMDLVMEF